MTSHYDPTQQAMNSDLQAALTPSSALEKLRAGNQRFVEQKPLQRNYSTLIEQTMNSQHPFAAVVGCIDSRVPPDIIFDQGIGDLFVARVAGNVIGEDILGSLEYATKVAGAKIIVVLGHTNCGAVKAACAGTRLDNLNTLLDNIQPSVLTVRERHPDISPTDQTLINETAQHNVEQNCRAISEHSPILKTMINEGTLLTVGAMYDVSSGIVSFL